MEHDKWKIVTPSSSKQNSLLLHGIRGLLRCDQSETVGAIAGYVMSQYPSLRIGAAWMERTRRTPIPTFFALLGGLTRFLEVRPGESRDGAVWVARLGNERRAIQSVLKPLSAELKLTELKFQRRPDAASISALGSVRRRGLLRTTLQIMRIARWLHRRHEFFKVLRVIELIGYYSRYLQFFQQGHFNLAIMSSHSNPHGIAFNVAARKAGVPLVLITHGMPVRPVAKLTYDLALVHCEAALHTYSAEGSRMGRVLIHGRRQSYVPMPDALPERMVVGIFLCKDVEEENLRILIDRLLDHPRVAGILVRPHPKNLWLSLSDWIISRHEPRLRLSIASSPFEDIQAADVVLGGNSSVLVDAVTAGRPSGYFSGIDYGAPDLHAFVAGGLIYPIDNAIKTFASAVPNGRASIDFEAMLRFYQRPEWPNVLRLFANIDEDESSVAAKLASALRQLASPSRIAIDG